MDNERRDDEKKYWVALSTHGKIGGRTLLKLYKKFKSLEKVWQAGQWQLAEAGLNLDQVEAVKEVISKKNPEKEWEKVQKHKIDVLIYPDVDYPKLLKELPDPPGILYLRGKILPSDEIALAVVGSRKFSTYGERVTSELVYPLASQKITIVSGLALGIDTLAHRSALEAGGRTLAVLGCGLDQIYPVSNIRLADKIIAGSGAIISEFPLGMPALRFNFPIRNRIIAGLSLGTLVVEAAPNSGSLLTATASIDYNREVFAVPGSIFSETSVGTNRLIKMGAKMVTNFKDILEELSLEDKKAQNKAQEIIPDSPEEEILLNLLKQPVLVDLLVQKSGLETGMVNSTLIQLEIKGKVTNLGGSQYVISGKLKS
ncbi:MAG: protecting protein DprA protein [Berkelbacteria bacterium GW2011_GWB1_38_5]|uniref:Protecting protein DprA protein n=2 Tax=Candidatus Berkelbacteria TaxID=1618330 RepID=A0A0G0I1K2_9BACT|nr:MAG: protecting protein DprA protein [Berkelbacteria bacterium GW2011_GWA1_36_9]KKQ72550.1 MAG: protecting protein DprA protein [Berkelbacteria bacterium GW2011_GWB1_38_5]